MKKTILTAAALATLFVSSCDMNKEPVGTLSDENAVENATDCMEFRNGAYTNLRALMGGSYITLPAIQGDEFFGTTINGNANGDFTRGNIFSNNGTVESVFAGCYGSAASLNFFLNRAEAVVEKYESSDQEIDKTNAMQVKRYIGEAEFARAYFYYYLADRFCNSPANIDGNADGTGIPCVTLYDPTGDRGKYPGRGTLNATYQFINDQLNDVYARLSDFEKNADASLKEGMEGQGAIYLNTYAVRALQCRVALVQEDWANCIKYGEEIVNSGIYKLADTQTAINNMWNNNTGSELIFVPYSSAAEGCPTTNTIFYDNMLDYAYFVPSGYVVRTETKHGNDGLYPSSDYRAKCWLSVKRDLRVQGTKVSCTMFTKFPTNTALNSGTSPSWKNRPMPFRLSETMLNLCEAYYATGQEAKAKEMYMQLRASRNDKYEKNHKSWDESLSGVDLRNAIRKERQRELIAEGYRMSDLRRWHEGFDRNSEINLDYPKDKQNIINLLILNYEVAYTPNDYRYVWPIPATELINNPQMRGQQNPGYN